MQQIYPLTEEVISRYRDMLVCVVYKNGARHIGVLESCRNGVVELDDSPLWFGRSRAYGEAHEKPASPAGSAEKPQKPARSRKTKKAKAAAVAKTNQSSTNYASHSEIPASAERRVSGPDPAKISLNDIAFLVLLV
ncbi:hypothetical protein [Paenibacillus nanensis]|uniref:hypothetical protein n=1 Tax=Paenibacillus nanensis TaxID=393251 RepID=UPI0011C482E1|nr:hypothetical protein [Paenibacillus nanensis]